MILSYQTLKRYCDIYAMISPYSERTIFMGMSYGLGPASYDFRIAQDIVIRPGGFVLCSTVEKVNMPDNVAARVCDKSTWARLGLVVQNTHFDPGFVGVPTIELTNHSKKIIKIKKGMPICQFVFEFLDHHTIKPYRGKYHNQPARPVEAKLEKTKKQRKSRCSASVSKKKKEALKRLWVLEGGS